MSRCCFLILWVMLGCQTQEAPERVASSCSTRLPSGERWPTLAHTGCFVIGLIPTAGLLPYEVNSELWTDGADKERYVFVPLGESLTAGDNGQIDYPVGTLLVKTFAMQIIDAGECRTRNLEVRFLEKMESGWESYSYAFSEDGLSTHLVEDSIDLPLTANIDGGTQDVLYHVPSARSCSACHSLSEPIGFEFPQLDGINPRYSDVASQLDSLEKLGVLDLASAPVVDSDLVDPKDLTQSIESRARSWLHSNCAHCHSNGGFAAGTGLFLERTRPFEQMGLCGLTNFYRTPRVVPGVPEQSGVYLRMWDENLRMPPIGVSVIDPTGARVVHDWLESLESCE